MTGQHRLPHPQGPWGMELGSSLGDENAQGLRTASVRRGDGKVAGEGLYIWAPQGHLLTPEIRRPGMPVALLSSPPVSILLSLPSALCLCPWALATPLLASFTHSFSLSFHLPISLGSSVPSVLSPLSEFPLVTRMNRHTHMRTQTQPHSSSHSQAPHTGKHAHTGTHIRRRNTHKHRYTSPCSSPSHRLTHPQKQVHPHAPIPAEDKLINSEKDQLRPHRLVDTS